MEATPASVAAGRALSDAVGSRVCAKPVLEEIMTVDSFIYLFIKDGCTDYEHMTRITFSALLMTLRCRFDSQVPATPIRVMMKTK